MHHSLLRAGALLVSLAVLPAALLVRRASDVPGLQTAEGLETTLFAESPLLVNPTDLDVDARGRVWVLEGFNYRTAMHPENPVKPEGDRIVILEDTDGDGRADRQKVFYQGRDVDAALGIAVLGNQVFVSAYEHVFVFTDADGDDRPESKEVLFKFDPQNSDHGVHAFVFGPDGRLYFNVGDASKRVMNPQGEVLVDRSGNRVITDGKPYRAGMVFRTERDGSGIEVLGHNFRNPYEVALDSYGTLWQSDNDDDGNRSTRINYVMEYGNYGYRDEMTGAAWSAYRLGMEEEIPRRHWHQADPGVVPNVLITGAGAPAGITVYEGGLLPSPYRGAMIHAEPGMGVVRAYPVQPAGAGYTGRIMELVKATDDPLFRPVDVAVAPDGSLFVADWYDPGVGGHDVGDFRQGRILRIAPPGVPYRPTAADVGTPAAAVTALQSPNMATRYLAYTALHRAQARAAGALERMWRSDDPRMRARALWLLAQIGGRGPRYVQAALRDADPDIRITGLRAARRTGMELVPIARQLVRDPSPQVRREVALALRHHQSPEAPRLWAELARQYDGRDRFYLEALGIGADRQWDRFVAAWRQAVGEGWKEPAGRDIVWRARGDAALPLLAELIRDPATSAQDRVRFFRAFDFHPGPARQRELLALLEGAGGNEQVRTLALVQLDSSSASHPAVGPALRRTLDATRGTEQFVVLARKFGARDRSEELLALALAQPDQTAGVEAARLVVGWNGVEPFRRVIDGRDGDAAMRALAVLGRAGGGAAERFLESVAFAPDRSLALRTEAVRIWGPSWNGMIRLLKLAQEGKVPAELTPAVSQVLLNSWRTPIRDGAVKLYGARSATTADGKPLPTAAALATRSGDAAAGRAVFQRACALCHTAGEMGKEFGPGLSEIGSKLAKEALYTAILHPSAGISFGYEGYVLRLRDGSDVAGIVASETGDELVLRRPGGLTTRYRKAEIASRTQMDRSIMPEGLAATMTERELVDLVEYLGTLKRAGG